MLNKEYSDKGSPYAEYYIANNQVVSQKMFGLHGLVTPGKEESLKTTGGLMYYQYDKGNTVTELTDRHGDEIEHYRYDAFGNIFTGITSPYNTTGYTGQDYDDVAGLVLMDARWYSPSMGRFTSQDTYMGDMYSSQSLNRYSYVMNNPVNMWDPTGHVPEWVGEEAYLTYMSDNSYIDHFYLLTDSWSYSTEWSLLDKIPSPSQITYHYRKTETNTWKYDHFDFNYNEVTNPETGETSYEFIDVTETTEIYSQTDYYYSNLVVSAAEMAQVNEEFIKNVAGLPLKNSDGPAVSISTLQVGSGTPQVLNPDEIIVDSSVRKSTKEQWQVTGAVQIELNDKLSSNSNSFNNNKLTVNGKYSSKTAEAVANFQASVGLTANGVLDAKTFYQLENDYLSRNNMQIIPPLQTEKLAFTPNAETGGGSRLPNGTGKTRRMDISSEGLEVIANFELSEGSIKAWGLGEYDNNGKLTGIYPHYVFKNIATDKNPEWVSDGGITFGYGHYVSKGEYNDVSSSERGLVDIYAKGASILPTTTPSNGVPFKVPNSSAMPISEVMRIYKEDIVGSVDAVNDFLIANNILLEQHQFDMLVSFTHQYGNDWWTKTPEKMLPKFIREGQGSYNPDDVIRIFDKHDDKARRAVEANIFNNGYK
jgi:RHS repeat-associated protein